MTFSDLYPAYKHLNRLLASMCLLLYYYGFAFYIVVILVCSLLYYFACHFSTAFMILMY